MNWFQRFDRVLTVCWDVFGFWTNIALLAIMVLVSCDAVLRYAFNSPVAGVLEGVELLLVFAVFASLAKTQADCGHISIGVLTERLGERARAGLRVVTALLAFALFSTMTWATGGLAWRSWQSGEYSAGLIAFPIYPTRIMVTVGCFLLCLQLVSELLTAIRCLTGNRENRR